MYFPRCDFKQTVRCTLYSDDASIYIYLESVRAVKLALPLYLKNEVIREEDGRQPYRELSVTVTVQPPCIVVRPPRILLTPVPLGSEASALITLLASGYPGLVSVFQLFNRLDI